MYVYDMYVNVCMYWTAQKTFMSSIEYHSMRERQHCIGPLFPHFGVGAIVWMLSFYSARTNLWKTSDIDDSKFENEAPFLPLMAVSRYIRWRVRLQTFLSKTVWLELLKCWTTGLSTSIFSQSEDVQQTYPRTVVQSKIDQNVGWHKSYCASCAYAQGTVTNFVHQKFWVNFCGSSRLDWL